MKFAQHK